MATMEFFKFDPLVDPKASLAALVNRFDESDMVVEIGCLQSNNSLHCCYHSQLEFTPQDAKIAMQRCVLMMKQYGDSEEMVVENCTKLMAHLCGQGTRPNARWLVKFEGGAGELEMVLPEFALADVGFRLWAGSLLLARLIFDNDQTLGNSPVVELGAGSGLCALANLIKPHPTNEVVITDFNQACLSAAKESAARFGPKAQVLFMDWTKDPGQVAGVRWQGAAVIGATIVYENRHAEEISQLLHVLFTKFEIHSAAIAVHRAHSGYDRFHSLVSQFPFFASLRLYQVSDDIGAHEVGVFCFQV
ncbi:hypothetical protein BASA81_001055 [Batrachochytrium salamandrivorans]|nr:hypothetical protein BASA81_001055 [Batrachochytrium salamandrivorans]